MTYIIWYDKESIKVNYEQIQTLVLLFFLFNIGITLIGFVGLPNYNNNDIINITYSMNTYILPPKEFYCVLILVYLVQFIYYIGAYKWIGKINSIKTMGLYYSIYNILEISRILLFINDDIGTCVVSAILSWIEVVVLIILGTQINPFQIKGSRNKIEKAKNAIIDVPFAFLIGWSIFQMFINIEKALCYFDFWTYEGTYEEYFGYMMLFLICYFTQLLIFKNIFGQLIYCSLIFSYGAKYFYNSQLMILTMILDILSLISLFVYLCCYSKYYDRYIHKLNLEYMKNRRKRGNTIYSLNDLESKLLDSSNNVDNDNDNGDNDNGDNGDNDNGDNIGDDTENGNNKDGREGNEKNIMKV